MTTKPWRTTQRLAIGAGFIVICAALAGLDASARPRGSTTLKEAKLNIEHNATDNDTGFQGAVDSEGWDRLELTGPRGVILSFEAKGELGRLGLTELFFESVEPENIEVPIHTLLADMPAGEYTYRARKMTAGEGLIEAVGTALLSHDIPAGPVLLSPAPGEVIPSTETIFRWGGVSTTITGMPVNIIGYQLIVEKDVEVHPHRIGKLGLSMYLPPTVTAMPISRDFFEPGTAYKWEVLAIEESGNQTLSSGEFRTQ
ncbi:MAG: hypothetical protein ABIP29_12440 [Candidatus Eisenbacteria bacterium]